MSWRPRGDILSGARVFAAVTGVETGPTLRSVLSSPHEQLRARMRSIETNLGCRPILFPQKDVIDMTAKDHHNKDSMNF
jgi:hypothetical protein